MAKSGRSGVTCERLNWECLAFDVCAVADGVDVWERLCDLDLFAAGILLFRLDLHAEMGVYSETACFAVLCNLAQALDFMADQASHEGILHKTCAPDHDTRCDLLGLFLDAHEEDVVVATDALEVMLCFDLNTCSLEDVCCVRGQVAVEHGQHFGRDVVDGDGDVRHQLWIQFGQVFVHQIVELSGKLDACRTTSHNCKVKESFPLSITCVG
ncbi:hypothetical protein HG530_003268 [Fusarium avenaceum]|nr:hypothetical protein HG530_003268 [Fusarium avenaceum]